MDCVSADSGRRGLEHIIFCCYHGNPTQGTLLGQDRALHSISFWFTNWEVGHIAPAAKCSALPLVQGSPSLGCVFSQKTAVGQAKPKLIFFRGRPLKEEGLTGS